MPVTQAASFFKPGFSARLFEPVNNSPLIVFRIIFGFLLFCQFATALWNGSIYANYIQPPFTFTFIGFEWLQPLPGNGMYIYVGCMLILSIMIMLGAWYRLAMAGFAVLWTLLYLVQKSGYNNHYYLLLLLCWIMVFLPANRFFSVDVKRSAVLQTGSCSRYCIWIFIGQIAIVYFYAAIAKLSSDWFSGKYIAIQFSRLSTHQVVGIIYAQKWFQLLICYGGFLFDLLIFPLLLWKKTRNYAFLFSIFFHLFNAYTFSIGIFPYLSIALNLFFLDAKRIQRLFFKLQPSIPGNFHLSNNAFQRKMIPPVFIVYMLLQLLIPIRSWIFPGNVFWTEEGYRMSWRMMLRTKSGKLYFNVRDKASGMAWKEDPAKRFSAAHVMWLSISPDIIWQYAQRLKKEYAHKGFPNVEVYAISSVSLNRSLPLPLVDSTVDLAHTSWEPFKHAGWITNH